MTNYKKNILSVYQFYYQGFKSMTIGKKLWLIIIIKLIIIFIIMKIFFFPNFLKSHFNNDNERSNYVIKQLTK